MANDKNSNYTTGRPTIYTDEFIENEAKELLKWINDKKNDAIFFNEFAEQRNYKRQRLSEFADKSVVFSDALEKAKQWQETKLLKMALTRKHDAGFTKFIMPKMCGDHWREEKNINIKSTGPVPQWIEEAASNSKDLIND